jgi:hypothetical protein
VPVARLLVKITRDPVFLGAAMSHPQILIKSPTLTEALLSSVRNTRQRKHEYDKLKTLVLKGICGTGNDVKRVSLRIQLFVCVAEILRT